MPWSLHDLARLGWTTRRRRTCPLAHPARLVSLQSSKESEAGTDEPSCMMSNHYPTGRARPCNQSVLAVPTVPSLDSIWQLGRTSWQASFDSKLRRAAPVSSASSLTPCQYLSTSPQLRRSSLQQQSRSGVAEFEVFDPAPARQLERNRMVNPAARTRTALTYGWVPSSALDRWNGSGGARTGSLLTQLEAERAGEGEL